jgi:hypothetical protein
VSLADEEKAGTVSAGQPWKLCPACVRDPDPRGPSACFDCRELNTTRVVPRDLPPHVVKLAFAIDNYVVAVRLDTDDVLGAKLALDGAVAAYSAIERLVEVSR